MATDRIIKFQELIPLTMDSMTPQFDRMREYVISKFGPKYDFHFEAMERVFHHVLSKCNIQEKTQSTNPLIDTDDSDDTYSETYEKPRIADFLYGNYLTLYETFRVYSDIKFILRAYQIPFH
jgi:hypothetical protein